MDSNGFFPFLGSSWHWWIAGALDVSTGHPGNKTLIAREINGMRILRTSLHPKLEVTSDGLACQLCESASDLEFTFNSNDSVIVRHGRSAEELNLASAALMRRAPITKVRIQFGALNCRTKDGIKFLPLCQWSLPQVLNLVPSSMGLMINQEFLKHLLGAPA